MNGYLLLEGNKIKDAGTGAPDGGWSRMHQPVPDIAAEPKTLVGKYYNPRARRVFDEYDPRSGNYFSAIPVTSEQVKQEEIESAKESTEEKACNWMVRFIQDVTSANKAITAEMIPSYVTDQLDKYLGENNYSLTK